MGTVSIGGWRSPWRRCLAAVATLTVVGLLPVVVGDDAGAAQAKGEPIKLGNVGQYTTEGFTGVPVGKAAIEAWAKWVNAHGGINGHPVELIVKDNKGDQAQAVSLVKELVEEENVVAFVSNQDGGLNAGYADYLKEQGIPVLGGNVYTLDPWVSNPMFFPQGMTAIPQITSIVDAVADAGYDTIGSVACSEASQCSAANALIKSLADNAGLEYTYGGLISSTAPDYTADCLSAKNAETEAIVLLIATADQGNKVAEDCARQDYKPAWVLPGAAVGPGYLNDSFNNAINNAPVMPWFVKDASTKDFRAAMKKYTKVDLNKADLPLSAPDAWVSGLMLQKAVELSGATGVPTTADVLAGLAQFQDENLGGMAGNLTFTDPEDKNQYCYWTLVIKKKKFTMPGGTTPTCVAKT